MVRIPKERIAPPLKVVAVLGEFVPKVRPFLNAIPLSVTVAAISKMREFD